MAFVNFCVEFIHLTRITEYIHNPLKLTGLMKWSSTILIWFCFNLLKTRVIVDPSCHCSQSCNMLTSKTLLNFITTLSNYEFTSTYQQLKMDISSTTFAWMVVHFCSWSYKGTILHWLYTGSFLLRAGKLSAIKHLKCYFFMLVLDLEQM